MPRVLNCRPKRTIPPGAVYVGRPSKWGNPFKPRESGGRFGAIHRFRQWFYANPDMVEAAKRELRGKDLVCYCAPLPCHADVLLEAANS